MSDQLSTQPVDLDLGPKRRSRFQTDATEESNEPKEKVEIDKAELQTLLKRIEKLENPGIIEKVKRVTEHVGYLRGWENKLVIGVGNMKENPTVHESDINRYQLPVLMLSMDGTMEEEKVPYLYFLENSDKWAIKMSSMTRLTREEVDMRKGGGGRTTKDAIDEKGRYTDRRTNEEIELAVTFVDVSVKAIVVEGPFTGKELDFDTEHINAINL